MIPHSLLVNVLRHIACVVNIGRMANVSRSFYEAMFDRIHGLEESFVLHTRDIAPSHCSVSYRKLGAIYRLCAVMRLQSKLHRLSK